MKSIGVILLLILCVGCSRERKTREWADLVNRMGTRWKTNYTDYDSLVRYVIVNRNASSVPPSTAYCAEGVAFHSGDGSTFAIILYVCGDGEPETFTIRHPGSQLELARVPAVRAKQLVDPLIPEAPSLVRCFYVELQKAQFVGIGQAEELIVDVNFNSKVVSSKLHSRSGKVTFGWPRERKLGD